MTSVHIDQLSVMYAGSMLVDCSFDIHRSLAVVGESGSGKSLILKALLSLGLHLRTTTVLNLRYPHSGLDLSHSFLEIGLCLNSSNQKSQSKQIENFSHCMLMI